MKRLTTLATVATLLVAAFDAPAFFRNDRIQQRESAEASGPAGMPAPRILLAAATIQAVTCALVIRWTERTLPADRVSIYYSGAAECRGLWRNALLAAGPIVSVPPAGTAPAVVPIPFDECAIHVHFSPATVNAPTVTYTGAGVCILNPEAARISALRVMPVAPDL